MTPQSHGAIHIHPVGLALQSFQNLLYHDWYMQNPRFATKSPILSAPRQLSISSIRAIS